MEWILIVFMTLAYGGGGSEQISFPTQASCEAAGDGVSAAAHEIRGGPRVFTVCVEVPPKVRM